MRLSSATAARAHHPFLGHQCPYAHGVHRAAFRV